MIGFQAIGGSAEEVLDKNGRVVMSADKSGNPSWYIYDANGTLKKERHPDGSLIEYSADERPLQRKTGRTQP